MVATDQMLRPTDEQGLDAALIAHIEDKLEALKDKREQLICRRAELDQLYADLKSEWEAHDATRKGLEMALDHLKSGLTTI